MDLINETEMTAQCSYTLDLRNETALPLLLVYLPMDWIVYYVVWPLVAFGTLSNISFIWTVIRTQTLHTSTYVYLVCLACADEINILSLGCLFAIDYATSPIGNGNYIFATIIHFLSTFAFMSSMGFVMLVSLERYLAICHPIKHHVLKGTKRTYRLIGIVLLISVGYTCVVIPSYVGIKDSITCVLWPEANTNADNPEYLTLFLPQSSYYFFFTQTVYLLLRLGATISTCYMYVCILRTMMIRANNRQLNVSNGFDKQLRQVAIMVMANGTFFFLCCSIQIISQTMSILGIQVVNERNYIDWLHLVYLSIAINSSINPLIYFITNQRYRKAFRSVFAKGYCNAVENKQKETNPDPKENSTKL